MRWRAAGQHVRAAVAGALAGSGLTGWGAVSVSGESMAPTLRPGDACLVRYGTTVHPGALVVARLPARPLGVKRATDHDLDGWWLSSDNPPAGTDSATFGRVADEDVLGRVVARYWPRPAWFRPSSRRARSYQSRQSA